jgi:hypothetical protein
MKADHLGLGHQNRLYRGFRGEEGGSRQNGQRLCAHLNNFHDEVCT